MGLDTLFVIANIDRDIDINRLFGNGGQNRAQNLR